MVKKLRGVQFGDYNTATDWALIMHEKTISPPKPKTNFVPVPGRDGDLDLTEALSELINYQDRIASFTFLLTNGTHEERESLITEIIGRLNGQRMRIIDTDDYPDYYLNGRLTVTAVKNSNAYGTLQIEAVCNPWRYSINSKSKAVTVESGDNMKNVILPNDGYKVLTPVLVVNGNVTLVYKNGQATLTTGTYTIPKFKLTPGINEVSVSGNGSITFEYREAIF